MVEQAFFPVVSKMIIQSGASFGLFMAVGGLVRCDGQDVFKNRSHQFLIIT